MVEPNELQLKLTEFEGPLDLLLHLIKKQEIDIYDIPIAQITTQYFDYLHAMQHLELEVAGDYLVMAATLMAIKSRLLLPQSKVAELESDDNEEVNDPRAALVQQLLAYSTYQEVSHYLGGQAQQRVRYFAKEETLPVSEIIVPLPRGIVSIGELGAALNELLQRQKQDNQFAKQVVTRESFSLDDATSRIEHLLDKAPKNELSFKELLVKPVDRSQVVSLFLACLELMKIKKISCYQLVANQEIGISREIDKS